MKHIDNYDDTTQLSFEEVQKLRESGHLHLYCVDDKTKSWRVLLLRRNVLYDASHIGEDGRPVILDLGEPAPQAFDMNRFRTREQLPKWAIEKATQLKKEWGLICDLLKKAGLEPPPGSFMHSGVYTEGFRWDIDNYTGEPGGTQTRRWDPEARQFVDGQDPLFEAPKPVPFNEPYTEPKGHVPFDGL